MEEQQVKPSDLPPTSSDNQDSVATPPVTSADPVRLVASSDSPSEVAGAAPAAVLHPPLLLQKMLQGVRLQHPCFLHLVYPPGRRTSKFLSLRQVKNHLQERIPLPV
jgi:hypothetical protein